MHHTLHLDKFGGVDFKYDHGFFEFQPENTPILEGFYFCMKNSHIEKLEGTDFENGNIFFKFQPKISKYEIFHENSEVFFLSESLSELNFLLFTDKKLIFSNGR